VNEPHQVFADWDTAASCEAHLAAKPTTVTTRFDKKNAAHGPCALLDLTCINKMAVPSHGDIEEAVCTESQPRPCAVNASDDDPPRTFNFRISCS